MDRVQALAALEDAIGVILRRYRQGVENDALTFGQFAVMRILAQDGPMAMGEVAQALGVSLAGATGLIDRLVHAQMVRRYRSETDRRVVWVELSEAGKEEYARLQTARNQYMARMFSCLDERELDDLVRILDRVAGSMEEFAAKS